MHQAKQNASAPSTVCKRLDLIREQVGVSFRDVAQLLNTRPETVSRWRSGKAAPQTRKLKKLATLAWVAEQLAEFYAPDEARMWLFSPHRLLKNRTPAACIEDDRLDEVLAIITQLQDGSFV